MTNDTLAQALRRFSDSDKATALTSVERLEYTVATIRGNVAFDQIESLMENLTLARIQLSEIVRHTRNAAPPIVLREIAAEKGAAIRREVEAAEMPLARIKKDVRPFGGRRVRILERHDRPDGKVAYTVSVGTKKLSIAHYGADERVYQDYELDII